MEEVGEVNEFLDRVVASYLIDEHKLQRLMDEFRQQSVDGCLKRFGLSITGVTAYLVHRGYLTCWQVEKLRQGKTKGFFYENELLLLDFLSNERGSVYLARRRSKSDTVVVEFSAGTAGMQYRILKVLDKSGLAWVDDSPDRHAGEKAM